jgi:hypothetical protein
MVRKAGHPLKHFFTNKNVKMRLKKPKSDVVYLTVETEGGKILKTAAKN